MELLEHVLLMPVLFCILTIPASHTTKNFHFRLGQVNFLSISRGSSLRSLDGGCPLLYFWTHKKAFWFQWTNIVKGHFHFPCNVDGTHQTFQSSFWKQIKIRATVRRTILVPNNTFQEWCYYSVITLTLLCSSAPSSPEPSAGCPLVSAQIKALQFINATVNKNADMHYTNHTYTQGNVKLWYLAVNNILSVTMMCNLCVFIAFYFCVFAALGLH